MYYSKLARKPIILILGAVVFKFGSACTEICTCLAIYITHSAISVDTHSPDFMIYAILHFMYIDVLNPMDPPEVLTPNEDVIPQPRIIVGGQFNRWLNITRTVIVQGAEDPDSKIFTCEVCIARGTPFEQCHSANYTSRLIGAPPRIIHETSEPSQCTIMLGYKQIQRRGIIS